MSRGSGPLMFVVLLMSLIVCGCGGGSTTSSQPSNPVPSITSVTPGSATAGSALTTITVAGANFIPSSAIQWNGTTRTPSSLSASGFTLDITAGDLSAAGTATLSVTNPAPGGGTATYSFTVNPPAAPVLNAVSPASIAPIGMASTITVTGSNFVRSSVVNWNGASRTTTYVSNTQLSGTLNGQDVASGGTAQVTVTTPSPGGGTSSAQIVKLEYPLPVIDFLSPATATWNQTSDFALTVNGSSFFPGALVQWNNVNRSTTFVSDKELRTAILASDVTGLAGTTYNVTVTNPTPNAGMSVPVKFTIVNPVPVLQSLSPNSGYGNSKDLLITVHGESFVNDPYRAPLTFGSVEWGYAYLDSTTLNFNLPWNLLRTYFDIVHGYTLEERTLPAGTYDVTFANPAPGGGTSNALQFTVLATDAPVTSTILKAACNIEYGCPYTLTASSRNMRYVIGTILEKRSSIPYQAWSMTDTCNDALPGCTISSIPYLFTDTGASTDSAKTVLSADGRFAAFAWAAVYERDTCVGAPPDPPCTPQSSLISRDTAGTGYSGGEPSISEDGRFVAFTSDGAIDPTDMNGLNDVYLRDTCIGATSCTPKTVLISQAAAGISADRPVVSPTGRFIGYRTTVSGSNPQLALYDTCLGDGSCTSATYAITDSATTYDAAAVKLGGISNSGRYVSFSAGTASQIQQVYLHDTCIGEASCTPSDLLVSVSTGGTTGDAASMNSALSSDARYVAFDSDATNLVPHDTNGATDVFWRDTCVGVVGDCSPRTVRISVDSTGVQMTGANLVQIRADGQEVAITYSLAAMFAKGPF